MFSQNIKIRDGDYLYKSYHQYKYSLNYDEVSGSPYLNDTLIYSRALMKGEDTVAAYMRYNIYEDDIEYLDDDQIFILENPEQVRCIYMGMDKFVYLTCEEAKITGWFIEKVSGYCTLFYKPVIEFHEAKAPLTSYHEPDPASFIAKTPQWFVIMDTGSLTSIKLKRSDLEDLFGEDFEHVDSYRKEQNLKFGREMDVIRVFKYYNYLHQSSMELDY